MCIHIVYTLGIHTGVYICCFLFFLVEGWVQMYWVVLVRIHCIIILAIALIDIECSYSHVLIIYYTLNCIHSTNEMK